MMGWSPASHSDLVMLRCAALTISRHPEVPARAQVAGQVVLWVGARGPRRMGGYGGLDLHASVFGRQLLCRLDVIREHRCTRGGAQRRTIRRLHVEAEAGNADLVRLVSGFARRPEHGATGQRLAPREEIGSYTRRYGRSSQACETSRRPQPLASLNEDLSRHRAPQGDVRLPFFVILRWPRTRILEQLSQSVVRGPRRMTRAGRGGPKDE